MCATADSDCIADLRFVGTYSVIFFAYVNGGGFNIIAGEPFAPGVIVTGELKRAAAERLEATLRGERGSIGGQNALHRVQSLRFRGDFESEAEHPWRDSNPRPTDPKSD
jgi:hypothetical protein